MADKRKPLSRRTRFEVFKRDDFICRYCGAHPPDVILHCDHIIPVSKGGTNAEENLVLAGYREVMEARAERIRQDAFDVAAILLMVDDGREFSVDRQWLRSIKIFNERLPLHVVEEAAELTLAAKIYSERRRFLYFCKVCWNKIKGEPE